MKHVALDIHDFCLSFNRFDVLFLLKMRIPNFKVSLFMIPNEITLDYGPYLVRDEALEALKENLDWIQIIPHSYVHSRLENRHQTYKQFENDLSLIKKKMDSYHIPYEHGYCSPHWKWNSNVVKVLDDNGWWGAIDRDKEMSCPKRYFKYNYRLNEPFLESDEEVLKLHGHIYGTGNDIKRNMESLFNLPQDTKWHFVTDYLESL